MGWASASGGSPFPRSGCPRASAGWPERTANTIWPSRLHAADDALRNQIVPANRGFGVAAILAAADEYFEQTGRRVTFEYVLLAGRQRPAGARPAIGDAASRPAGAW